MFLFKLLLLLMGNGAQSTYQSRSIAKNGKSFMMNMDYKRGGITNVYR